MEGMKSEEGAAQQRPRFSPELLVEEIFVDRPRVLPPTMPAAYWVNAKQC
jgi:hypothetical protein